MGERPRQQDGLRLGERYHGRRHSRRLGADAGSGERLGGDGEHRHPRPRGDDDVRARLHRLDGDGLRRRAGLHRTV